MTSRTGRGLAFAVVTLGAVLLLAGPAAAHAVLVSTSPADGQSRDAPPETVSATFSESVDAPEGALRVYDGNGERVDAGDARISPSDPQTIVVSLRPDIPDGTYVAAWRAVSADGHPIHGAFVFAIGEGATIDEGLLAQIIAGDDERVTAILATLGRGLAYITTLIAAGIAAFLLLVGPLGEPQRRRLASLGVAAATGGIVLTALAIPLQAALETGLGWQVLLRGDLLGSTLASNVGLSAGMRALGLLLVIGAFWPGRTSPTPIVATCGGALAVWSYLLVGHTVISEPRWVVVGADAVHVASAALWFGGLVALGVYMRRPASDPVVAAGVVSGFSRLALLAVVAVVVSGLALAWVEVRALRALLPTAYGVTLIAKAAVVGVVVAVATYNNRRLVPAIRSTHAVPAGGSNDEHPNRPETRAESAPAWRQLRRTVRVESGALVLVLLITGGLVYMQPAREAAGVTGVFSTYADVGDRHEVNLVVDPNRAGRNEIHLYVTDRETFRPLSPLAGAEVHLEISMPAEDLGPIVRQPRAAGPGHWLHVGDELAFPGAWEITLVVRLDEFEQVRTTIPVRVNP